MTPQVASLALAMTAATYSGIVPCATVCRSLA
jgi:hypothetical protein